MKKFLLCLSALCSTLCSTSFSTLCAALASAQVPRPAGPLIIGGRDVAASGRPILLAFISTECGHCAAAAKTIEARLKEFPGVQFEAVAFNETPDLARFARDTGATFGLYAVPRGAALKFLGLAEGIVGTPQMVYIDRAGVIRAQSDRRGSPVLQTEDGMKAILQALLRRPK